MVITFTEPEIFLIFLTVKHLDIDYLLSENIKRQSHEINIF